MTQDCSHSPFTATVGNPFTKGIASSGLKNVSAQKVEGTPFSEAAFIVGNPKTIKAQSHDLQVKYFGVDRLFETIIYDIDFYQ